MPECMFCEASPCECGDRTRKGARKAVTPKITPPKQPLSGPSLAVRPAANLPVLNKIVPPRVQERQSPSALNTTQSVDDLEFAASLRALEPLLGDEDKRAFSYILSVPPTRDEKIVAWKRLCNWRREQRD